MSDIVQAGGGLAVPNPLGRPEGLEDFGAEEQVMPMIRIDHKNGVFEDALSQATYPELTVVMLGRVRGRILWPASLAPEGTTEQPLCRSYDFATGIPVLQDKDGNVEQDRFPWAASGFTPTTEPLPCQTCRLKEWDTHPKRDNAPWCSETHSFGICLPIMDGDTLTGFQPSIIQIQRSSIGASKTYCTSFAGRQVPMFTVWTRMTLDRRQRGTNDYCVIQFKEIQPTDEKQHTYFSTTFRGIRTYLTTPRQQEVDEGGDDLPVQQPASDVPVSVAPQQAPAAESAPVSEAAPAAPEPAPAPVAQPAPAEPAAAPAAAPAAPPATPFGTPAPAAAPAAPAAPPAAVPAAAPAAAPAAPPAAAPAVPAAPPSPASSTELPF